MTQQYGNEVLKDFNPKKVILPVLIGLGVVVLLLARNFDKATFEAITWSWGATFWIGIAFLLLAVRHYALMARIKILTGNRLSWGQTFQIISLWEFGSAATPSTVGGTAVAIFLMAKEHIKPGETISVILFTVFLDSLFFLISIPLVWLLLGNTVLSPSFATEMATTGYWWLMPFLLGYMAMVGYTLAIGYGLFVNPKSFKGILVNITRLPFLNRWAHSAEQTGNDMLVASKDIKTKGAYYWGVGVGTTLMSWTIRFLILNAIFMAFAVSGSQLLLLGRQLIIYIIMVLSPTPGGSGIAEWVFGGFLYDFFPGELGLDGVTTISGLWVVVAFVWRLVSYYPYLFLGVIVLPLWINRVFGKTEKKVVIQ